MLLLDTSAHPVADREAVMRDGFQNMVGVRLAPDGKGDLIDVRFRVWDLGDGCAILDATSSGIMLCKPATSSSSEADSPLVGFAMMPAGACRFSQNDRHEIVPDGGIFITEMSDAFSCHLPMGTEGANLLIPLDVLDVPLREVQNAAQWLPRSPLYGLACQHMRTLLNYTKQFDAPHPSAQQSALHVLRALIKSFGTD